MLIQTKIKDELLCTPTLTTMSLTECGSINKIQVNKLKENLFSCYDTDGISHRAIEGNKNSAN